MTEQSAEYIRKYGVRMTGTQEHLARLLEMAQEENNPGEWSEVIARERCDEYGRLLRRILMSRKAPASSRAPE